MSALFSGVWGAEKRAGIGPKIVKSYERWGVELHDLEARFGRPENASDKSMKPSTCAERNRPGSPVELRIKGS